MSVEGEAGTPSRRMKKTTVIFGVSSEACRADEIPAPAGTRKARPKRPSTIGCAPAIGALVPEAARVLDVAAGDVLVEWPAQAGDARLLDRVGPELHQDPIGLGPGELRCRAELHEVERADEPDRPVGVGLPGGAGHLVARDDEVRVTAEPLDRRPDREGQLGQERVEVDDRVDDVARGADREVATRRAADLDRVARGQRRREGASRRTPSRCRRSRCRAPSRSRRRRSRHRLHRAASPTPRSCPPP